MTKRQYAEAIAKQVNGEVKEAEKANGVKFVGVCIKGEGNVSPLIYIDTMYDREMPVDAAVAEVQRLYKANAKPGIDLSVLNDYENVKPLLRARLYNKATNAEVYRSAEAYGYDDLIIVPVIELGELLNGTSGSIKVNNAILSKYGVAEDELIDTALKNSTKETEVVSLFETICAMTGMTPMPGMPGDDGTMVVSNEKKMYGAIGVICKAKELAEKFPDGYVVLPSSVHEVLIRPYDEHVEALSEMVNVVNDSAVDPEEQLGNRAYVQCNMMIATA